MNSNNLYKAYVLVVSFFLGLNATLLSAQTSFETYTNETRGYSIEYASGWQVMESQYEDGGTHFIDVSTNPPAVAINVNKVRTSVPVTQVANSTEEFILSQPGMGEREIVSEKEITASGLQGIEKTVVYQMNNNSINIKSAYLSNGTDVVTISITGTAQAIEEQGAVFNHMLNHINLL